MSAVAGPLDEAARFAPLRDVPGAGAAGQALLREARVHVVGAGTSAGPALLALAQAGIGTLYLDDGGDVAPEDASAWLYAPAQQGRPRLFAALEGLGEVSALTTLRAWATGTTATATLVCVSEEGLARRAAEEARRAGIPHVVALASGEGGWVVSVPSGAPCYGCASRPGAGTRPRGAVPAAVGTLGALELLLLVAGVLRGEAAGRRLDLAGGLVQVAPTARRPGCDCAQVY
jgi:adenylyltransferase/sulfurtransferase